MNPGEEIIHPPSYLSAADRLQQDASKKDRLECLRKMAKETHRESFTLFVKALEKSFEWNKMDFTRTMEKAYLTNEIINERYLRNERFWNIGLYRKENPYLEYGYNLRRKGLVFNEKIRTVMLLGLDGYMLNILRNQRASSSSSPKLECFHGRLIADHKDVITEKCEDIYRSLLRREREEGKSTTEIEILGYTLLKEITDSALNAHMIPVFSKESQDSIMLAYIRNQGEVEERSREIEVSVNQPMLYKLSGERSFDELLASDYEHCLSNAQSTHSHSEIEQMESIEDMAHEKIKEHEACFRNVLLALSEQDVVRPFESKLVGYCEELSNMRYCRSLIQFSDAEQRIWNEMGDLASRAIRKYRVANGPESFPVITEPVLPSFCTRGFSN